MCLLLLDRVLTPGEDVLDLGTGSAILAVAAARAGAGRVLALDNDPAVLEVATENIELNRLTGRIEAGVGSWGELRPGDRFGLIVANIHRTALVRGARALAGHLAPGGRAVLSGFSAKDAPLVQDAWRKAGLVPHDDLTDGDWAALALHT
jgi:ribosomal protein L11 methyltransferase